MKKIKINYLFVDITAKCNLSCPHCMHGGNHDISMTPETMDNLLEHIGYVRKLYISGGEISCDLDTLELFLHKLQIHKVKVERFRFFSNLMIQSERFISIIEKYQSYQMYPQAGKLLISHDIYHFLDIGRGVSPVHQSIIDKYSGKQKDYLERFFSKECLVYNSAREKRLDDNIEWYKGKTNIKIRIRKASNSLVFTGNAERLKKAIVSYNPKVKEIQTNHCVYAGSDEDNFYFLFEIYVTGDFALDEGGYYDMKKHGFAGNVNNDLLSEIEKHNRSPKVQTLGMLNYLGMCMNDIILHCPNQLDRGLAEMRYMLKAEPYLESAKKYIENESDQRLIETMEKRINICKSLYDTHKIAYDYWFENRQAPNMIDTAVALGDPDNADCLGDAPPSSPESV